MTLTIAKFQMEMTILMKRTFSIFRRKQSTRMFGEKRKDISIEDIENNKHPKVLDNCQKVDNIDDIDIFC